MVRIRKIEDDLRKITPANKEVKASVPDWLSLFSAYRTGQIREDEVVQGVLRPELDPDGPVVRDALTAWNGTHFLHQRPDGAELTLMRPTVPRRRERWWLHVTLALLTLLSTTIAGAFFEGRNPLSMTLFPVGSWNVPLPVDISPSELLPGLAFSVPLMIILLGHELGHYLVARWHGMDVSPPYFIPAPNWLNLVGTFGAFIRLRSVVLNRVVLLDVGVGGPLVSFVLSLPALIIGLMWSVPIQLVPETASHYVVFFGPQPIWLGDSLVLLALSRLVGEGSGIWLLDPLALAGWLGLFVTTLNLFPLSQLDGGHILYALFGKAQRAVGIVFFVLLLVLGRWWWGWWFWAVLIMILGRGSIGHPAVFDPDYPVAGRRRWLGWACIIIFMLTFVPVPLNV